MWDRLLYRIRARIPDLGRGLGSWQLSIVLMVWAALFFLLLAVFGYLSATHVVQSIGSMAPFWLLYALLLVNTAVCLWGRLGTLRRELGTKQGWATLGTFLFHGAFLLVAAGFALSVLTRHEAEVRVAVGEEFAGRPEQFLSQSPPRMLSAGLPMGSFRTERISAGFWQDRLLFTRLEADLVVDGGRERTTRINDPIWWDWCTFLRLSGYGYAPRYEIVDRAGLVLDSAFVKLEVFPPGQRDFFQAAHYPHRFYVEVLPDYAEVEGDAITRSMNLARPAVVVRVLRGKVDLGGATLRPGEGFTFEGLTIRFPEIRPWGTFSIVRDPGMPVLFAGYLVGLAGLLLGLHGRLGEDEG